MNLDVDRLEPIKALSYWRYVRLSKCFLSGAYSLPAERTKRFPTARGRSQILGNIFHSVMEKFHEMTKDRAITMAEFRTSFNKIIEETAITLQKDSRLKHLGDIRTWPELTEIYRNLSTLVEKQCLASSDPSIQIHTEKTLQSKDGLLFGKVDAFFVSNDGIEVVDYKSGTVLDGELPKEAYANQLQFYAYLIQETFDVYPRKLSLISRSLQAIEVPASIEQSVELANRMRVTLAEFNNKIAQIQSVAELASPSCDNCALCDLKISCEPFWQATPDLDMPDWAHTIIGRQKLPIKKSHGGVVTLELEKEKGTIRSTTVQICRIFEGRFPQLKDAVNQRLIIANIRLVSNAEPAIAEATERTVIVPLDGA